MKKIFKLILLFAVFVNPTAKSDEFDVKAKTAILQDYLSGKIYMKKMQIYLYILPQ